MWQQYFSVSNIDEALQILADHGERARIVAGGTDLMIKLKRGVLPHAVTSLLSVHGVEGMRGVRRENGEIAVGAATTTSDLISDPVAAEHAPILGVVADRIASVLGK